MEEFTGGNACKGEPFDSNGYGKCSVGEPAEGSFIIRKCFSRIHVQKEGNFFFVYLFVGLKLLNIPKYLKFSTMDI